MNQKVLMVDDDEELLNSFRRHLYKTFTLSTASTPEEALRLLQTEAFMVVVSDYLMPKMDGIQLLSLIRERAPDATRILLTGYADITIAIEAVNKGHIFRFLTKPCTPEVLTQSIEAGLEYHRLVTAERILLEKTLNGSISMLVEILGLVNPAAFSRSARIKKYVSLMVKNLNISPAWYFELAATLSQIGFVTLPSALLEKVHQQKPLAEQEQLMFANHPLVASRLVEKIPRLEVIAPMIAGQEKPFYDYPTLPFSLLPKEPSVLGAQMLKVAIDYDNLANSGHTHADILRIMESRRGHYNLVILSALGEPLVSGKALDRKKIHVFDLKVGMIVDEDIFTVDRMLLLKRGQEVTETVLTRLCNIHTNTKIQEPFQVLFPTDG
jgi:response regulator RpfG family c-di-GMP phosphodiesterase